MQYNIKQQVYERIPAYLGTLHMEYKLLDRVDLSVRRFSVESRNKRWAVYARE